MLQEVALLNLLFVYMYFFFNQPVKKSCPGYISHFIYKTESFQNSHGSKPKGDPGQSGFFQY